MKPARSPDAWPRLQRRLTLLATGGLTLGWLQAAGALQWAELITRVLSYTFSYLVTVLLGGNLNDFLFSQVV